MHDTTRISLGITVVYYLIHPDLDKTIEIFKFIFGYDKQFILNKIHFFNRPVNNKHNKQHQLE